MNKLKTYQPAVIGLDIIRDLPQEPGHTQLVATFKETKNLIAVEKVLPDSSGFTFEPPPSLPPKQIGFTDALIDTDGKQRRSFLGTSNRQNQWRLSSQLKLAKTYLKTHGIPLENVEGDQYGMRFGKTKLPRFHSNSGGYVQADADGSQILINVRNLRKPFHKVSLTEIQSGKINPDWIRGKIVLIGMTSPSVKDYVTSSEINSEKREVQSNNNLSPQEFVSKLQQLNQELRDVYDLVKREAVSELDSFYFRQEQRLDLSQPLDEILSEVYNEVIERNYA